MALSEKLHVEAAQAIINLKRRVVDEVVIRGKRRVWIRKRWSGGGLRVKGWGEECERRAGEGDGLKYSGEKLDIEEVVGGGGGSEEEQKRTEAREQDALIVEENIGVFDKQRLRYRPGTCEFHSLHLRSHHCWRTTKCIDSLTRRWSQRRWRKCWEPSHWPSIRTTTVPMEKYGLHHRREWLPYIVWRRQIPLMATKGLIEVSTNDTKIPSANARSITKPWNMTQFLLDLLTYQFWLYSHTKINC